MLTSLLLPVPILHFLRSDWAVGSYPIYSLTVFDSFASQAPVIINYETSQYYAASRWLIVLTFPKDQL